MRVSPTTGSRYLETDRNGVCDRAALFAGCDKICPVCGTEFIVPSPSLWAYKIGRGSHVRYYCRYKCWRAAAKKG